MAAQGMSREAAKNREGGKGRKLTQAALAPAETSRKTRLARLNRRGGWLNRV
jgi:hypothetical protein